MFGWTIRQTGRTQKSLSDSLIDQFEFVVQPPGILIIRPKTRHLDSGSLEQVCRRLKEIKALCLSRIRFDFSRVKELRGQWSVHFGLLIWLSHCVTVQVSVAGLQGQPASAAWAYRHSPALRALLEEPHNEATANRDAPANMAQTCESPVLRPCYVEAGQPAHASPPESIKENRMKAHWRPAGAISTLALFTPALFIMGCDGLESNRAACMRMFEDVTCGSPAADISPQYDFFVSQLCSTVPETNECNGWSALADCVTNVYCTELSTVDPLTFDPQIFEACNDIASGLEDNGCFPEGF